MPNTGTITDKLPEIIDSTWGDVAQLLRAHFIDHGGELPDLNNDLDYSGSVSELIDSAVPLYDADLAELAYFHHNAAIAALTEQFGSADGDWPPGTFAAGLYCLIEAGVAKRWDDEAKDLWDDWTASLDTVDVRKFALQQLDAADVASETSSVEAEA